MTLSITEDIRSITELKRDTSAILQHLHTSGRPVVLTVNGKAEAVSWMPLPTRKPPRP